MTSEENGIFIKLLEIGEERGANGITKIQALNRLAELGLAIILAVATLLATVVLEVVKSLPG